ncbi:MAG: glcA [Firmicutes bacterium]|nr:glcA [Bacillota bacterium]
MGQAVSLTIGSTGSHFASLFTLIPIVWLLVSLVFLKLPAYKACTIGLSLSIIIATVIFQMPHILAWEAALEGAALALLPILWVIFSAFYMYNLSLKTGAMDQIKNFMFHVSGDRRIQALTIAWGFGGFLEAVAGFGTAVAIPASILTALGFEPFFAAIICLLANTIAVAFGVVGIPVTTLAKIAELPVMPLSSHIALQLFPFVVFIPFLLVFTLTKTRSGCRGIWITTLAAGLSFAIPQYVSARYLGPELPAIIGSILSFTAIIFSVKFFPPPEVWRFPHEQNNTANTPGNTVSPCVNKNIRSIRQPMLAWSPYAILLILVLGSSNLFPAVHTTLSQVNTSLLIYSGQDGKPLHIDWILTPGTLIMISAIAGALVQGASFHDLTSIFGETVLQLQKTALTVVSVVSMAKVLGYSGMVSMIAVSLAGSTGSFYPVIAPLIGALGTFITGSDTSSNVLFGQLQKNIALQIGSDPSWIAASNTSGACAGKLISPQNIAIAATATGLLGREGDILIVMIKYVSFFIAALGIITYVFAF